MMKPKDKVVTFFLVLMGSIFVICYGVYSFMNGFHNVDLSYNFKCYNVQDLGSDEKVRSPDEGYMLGIKQMFQSLFYLVIGSLGWGIGYAVMLNKIYEG